MADMIDDAIEQAAIEGIASVSADGVSITAMDVEKQIRAAEYLTRKNAARKNTFGVSARKFQFGGCG